MWVIRWGLESGLRDFFLLFVRWDHVVFVNGRCCLEGAQLDTQVDIRVDVLEVGPRRIFVGKYEVDFK